MATEKKEPEPYVHQSYPATRYHATEPSRVVQDEAEDKALGHGWYDSPKKVPQASAKKVPQASAKTGDKE